MDNKCYCQSVNAVLYLYVDLPLSPNICFSFIYIVNYLEFGYYVLNVEYLHERNKYIHNLMIKYVKSLITCTVRKKANNNSFLQKVEFRKRFPQISWRNSCMKNKMLLVRRKGNIKH